MQESGDLSEYEPKEIVVVAAIAAVNGIAFNAFDPEIKVCADARERAYGKKMELNKDE